MYVFYMHTYIHNIHRPATMKAPNPTRGHFTMLYAAKLSRVTRSMRGIARKKPTASQMIQASITVSPPTSRRVNQPTTSRPLYGL